MKKNLTAFGRHAAVFAVTLAALWLMLLASALIPNSALRANMERSAMAYRSAEPFPFTYGQRWNSVADNYADAIWLNVSWNMGEGAPVSATLNTRYYDGSELGENMGLYLTVTEGAEPNTDYTRYWHGSAVFIRLLHLVTDAEGVKLIGFAAALILAAMTMVMLVRKKHWDIALLLALALAAVQIWNIRLSLEYQPAVVLTFVLCPLYLAFERRGDGFLTMLSVAGGAAVAFFDFLTTETMTILLPLILVVAVREKENRLGGFRESILLLLRCGICWLLAYGGAFVLKWALASLVTGENAFAPALSSVAERMGTMVEDAPNNVFSSVAANLTVIFGGTERVQIGRVAICSAAVLMVLLSVWYLFRTGQPHREAALLLLMLGAVVFLRYLALNNHSYLHEFFTYRALVSPILALLLALRLNVELPGKKGRRR